MKTIQLFTAATLLLASFGASASDKVLKERKSGVAIAPYVLTENNEKVPAELSALKAKKMLVPLAPFEWGTAPDELEIIRALVPAAPIVFGDSGDDVPAGLTVKKKNAKVPVAPIPLAQSEEVPLELAGL